MQTSVLQCRLEAFPELPEQKGEGSKPGLGNGFDPEWVTLSNYTSSAKQFKKRNPFSYELTKLEVL